MKETPEANNKYISFEAVVSALGVALMLIGGWLFMMLIDSQRDLSGQQSILKERSAISSTAITDIKARQNRISDRQYEVVAESAAIQVKVDESRRDIERISHILTDTLILDYERSKAYQFDVIRKNKAR